MALQPIIGEGPGDNRAKNENAEMHLYDAMLCTANQDVSQ